MIGLVGVNDPANRDVPDERPFVEQLRCIENLEINYVDAKGMGPFDILDEPDRLEPSALSPFGFFLLRSLTAAAEARDAEILFSGLSGEYTLTARPIPFYLELASRSQWARTWRELAMQSERTGVPKWRLLGSEIYRHVWQRPGDEVDFFPSRSFMRATHAQWVGRTPWQPDHRRYLLKRTIDGLSKNALKSTRGPDRVFNPSVPFLDKNLLEFCLALPAEFKQRDGTSRHLVRKLFSPSLPEQIAWRTKKMWGSPDYLFRYNSQIDKALRFVKAIRKSDPVREIVDVDRLEKAICPISDPLTLHWDAMSAIPRSMYVICFLRQFPAFRT